MALRRFGRDGGAAGGAMTREPPAGTTTTAARRPVGRAPRTAPATTVAARDEFGGMNIGAAFFGWLVAIGMATILTAVVVAAGAAIGLTNASASAGDAGTIGIVGGALLLVVLALSYYCGGYVAGRMSRFDGGRQGFGVWLIGLCVTLLVGGAGALFGSKYNVLHQLDLPRIPIDEGTLATAGAIALATAFVVTLLAAVLGGRVGRRYHLRVDRAGLADQ